MKNGLSDEEVIVSRKKYGNNLIKGKEADSFFSLFVVTLGDPIIKILLIALAIKTLFLFHDFDWYETIGIVIAIFVASFISSISEYGSEKAFNKLQEDASLINCKVKRKKGTMSIQIGDVVVGDIVCLETGDEVPADGVIISGSVDVSEASLNGESGEVGKKIGDEVFRSSVVYSGIARMVVNKVGNDTIYGSLAMEVSEKNPISPLKKRLTHLAKQISYLGYIGAFLVSFSYLFNVIVIDNYFNVSSIINTLSNFSLMFGYILHALTLSVTIIVVAVPEGLPMMITLVLSSNMKRMLKNNVLVKRLTGIETAGNINMLFTDKTGTLTKGMLKVVGISDCNDNVYYDENDLKKNHSFYELVRLSLIGNNSSEYGSDGIVGGNITDRALLEFFNRCSYEKKDVIPFSSERKYGCTKVRYKNTDYNLIKGAPEVILDKCSHYYDGDKRKGFFHGNKVKKQLKSVMSRGVRVIACATSDSFSKFDRLTLVGFVYIKDEVRPEARDGIGVINGAGVNTVMITGDNVNTARSIGKEVGLVCNDSDLVFTSDDLKRMSDDEIKKVLPFIKVIARALPQDKSRLVRLAQECGLVVGMTGDGVNDAPALKKADVGFSMGSGTEVAKEASDIVILDDNLVSISNAILYGRTIFKSIRKFIIFQLTVNLCAVSISIVGPFIGVDTPVTVIQMLWINMVMDTLAGIAFSYEPTLLEYMKELPKKKDEMILNGYMLNEIIVTGLFSSILCILFLKLPFVFDIYGDYKSLMTAFFGLFIFISIFNAFNARTYRLNVFASILKNKVFLVVILFIFVVQVAMIYFGGDMFRTYGLSLSEFEFMIVCGFMVIPFELLRKIIYKKLGYSFGV